ncbi:MAG: DUF4363 family protein [Bacillota bacterium]|nr:DUF4363 family protein [Clostridia bacterium]
MAKRIILYSLVGLTIAAIFLFAASTNYLKKPIFHDDNVPLHISRINRLVDKGDWTGAQKELILLEKAWKKVQQRVQFTGEEDDIKKISESLLKLKLMLEIKDFPGAKEELATIEFGWHDIGN